MSQPPHGDDVDAQGPEEQHHHDGDALSISLGHCCFKQLTWECQVSPKVVLDDLCKNLASQGFRKDTSLRGLRDLVTADGHRLIIVISTRRLQLRLHYLTPTEARANTAKALASTIRDEVSALIGGADSEQPE